MDTWSSLLLERLTSSGYSVTIFDNRGVGEPTAGSARSFKNDKADILGFSMGSFIAQELTLTNPEKLDNPILYASGCDDREAEPPSPEVIQIFSNTSMSPQELGLKIIILLFPADWFKANPDYLNYFPVPKESVSPEIMGSKHKP